ncbi:alginate export family protein [Halopseudomonas sp.]|uniref:alginate export family protein n=1 Tax=Halopseudomonas sp. TaxID=2901191 RepID=UPI0039E2AA60
MLKTLSKASRAPLLVIGVGCAGLLISDVSNAQLSMEYGADLRYRYEWFDIDETSKASTIRLGLKAKANVGDYFSGFAEFEAVEQFNNGYNVPTVPDQNKPGYPVIADPSGSEMNQAYVQYADLAGLLQMRAGRQEIMLNNGRFISTSGLRQNHQSFNGFTLTTVPVAGLKLESGYLNRALRVLGERASNGRADMDSHFYNLGYQIDNLGTLKTYACCWTMTVSQPIPSILTACALKAVRLWPAGSSCPPWNTQFSEMPGTTRIMSMRSISCWSWAFRCPISPIVRATICSVASRSPTSSSRLCRIASTV